MDYFPLFIRTTDRAVLFVGGSEDAGHKLALIAKSSARLILFGAVSDSRITAMIEAGTVTHHPRPVTLADTAGAAFAYIAADDHDERDAAIAVFSRAGLPYCVVDDRLRLSLIHI